MRLKLTLNYRPDSTLSLNYHYALQAVIYKVLERADPVFSNWLHEYGYEGTGEKKFKLFAFSPLEGYPYFIDKHKQTIIFRGDTVIWQVSFYVDEGMEKFISGLFQNQIFDVVTPAGRTQFTVQSVEMLAPPNFSTTMRFRATSPICIAEKDENHKHKQYRTPNDVNYDNLFFGNIKDKHKSVNKDSTNDAPTPTLKILSEPRMKGLTLYKKEAAETTKTIGYTFDFEITAPETWLRAGYDAGFGSNNPIGFGFCEVLK